MRPFVSVQLRNEQSRDIDDGIKDPISPLPDLLHVFNAQAGTSIIASLQNFIVSAYTLGANVAAEAPYDGQVFPYVQEISRVEAGPVVGGGFTSLPGTCQCWLQTATICVLPRFHTQCCT